MQSPDHVSNIPLGELVQRYLQRFLLNVIHIVCTLGVVNGCLAMHVDFLKVVYVYLINLYKGLQREIFLG